MLDWVFKTSSSIALSSAKKKNLGICIRQTITSLRRPLRVLEGCPLDVGSGCPWDVKSRRPRDIRSGRPQDGQIGCLGNVMETLDGEVLGTYWGPIFAGWELISPIINVD